MEKRNFKEKLPNPWLCIGISHQWHHSLRGGGQLFCDDSTKALVTRGWGGMGSKIVQKYVTPFMDNPFQITRQKSQHFLHLINRCPRRVGQLSLRIRRQFSMAWMIVLSSFPWTSCCSSRRWCWHRASECRSLRSKRVFLYRNFWHCLTPLHTF